MRACGCLLCFGAVLVLSAGCASVPAYDREALAHRAMTEPLDPERSALAGHVAGAREAALNPGNSAGGGCGCN
jgi:Domain of unknown function (DUF4266)